MCVVACDRVRECMFIMCVWMFVCVSFLLFYVFACLCVYVIVCLCVFACFGVCEFMHSCVHRSE